MPFSIVVPVVAGIAGAAISGNAAKDAAQTAADASRAGTDAQLQMFNTTQANYKPQIQLGQGAANMLSGIYGMGGSRGGGAAPMSTGTQGYDPSSGYRIGAGGGISQMIPGGSGGGASSSQPSPDYSAFYNSPGYKFSLDQGTQAINKQAAASGGLYSSNTLAAQNNYAQGTASTQYNSYINQLLSMAGLGNAAASGVGSAATATGQGVANSLQNAGNAQASGILGQSNAFSNALGSGGNMMSNYLTNPSAGGSYGGEFAPGVSTNVTFQDPYTSAGIAGGYGG